MMSCYTEMGFSLTWIILYLTNQSTSQYRELLSVLFAFHNNIACRFVLYKCIETTNKEIFLQLHIKICAMLLFITIKTK